MLWLSPQVDSCRKMGYLLHSLNYAVFLYQNTALVWVRLVGFHLLSNHSLSKISQHGGHTHTHTHKSTFLHCLLALFCCWMVLPLTTSSLISCFFSEIMWINTMQNRFWFGSWLWRDVASPPCPQMWTLWPAVLFFSLKVAPCISLTTNTSGFELDMGF